MVRSSVKNDFLIIECDCYEGDGRNIILPNNTILKVCEKCYKCLREPIIKELGE